MFSDLVVGVKGAFQAGNLRETEYRYGFVLADRLVVVVIRLLGTVGRGAKRPARS